MNARKQSYCLSLPISLDFLYFYRCNLLRVNTVSKMQLKEKAAMPLQAEPVRRGNNKSKTADLHQINSKDQSTSTIQTTSQGLKMLNQSKERPIILN